MDLNTLANLAEIFAVIIVVGGFAFAVLQLMQFRRERADRAAIELARSFGNPEFARALRLVLSLPAGIRARELQKRDARYEDAALLVSFTLESVGIMVHRRIVSLEIAWELMGGVFLGAWDRLGLWVEDVRQDQGPKFDEWTQWLAEQMHRHMIDSRREPAYRRYSDWKP